MMQYYSSEQLISINSRLTMTTAHDFELLRQRLNNQQSRRGDNQRIRLVKTGKWKTVMLQALDLLRQAPQQDLALLDDLRSVVDHLPEEKFVEAIVSLQPYKPNFKMTVLSEGPKRPTLRKTEPSPLGKDLSDQTKTSSSSIKHSGLEAKAARMQKQRLEFLSNFIEEQTLSKELSRSGHPYAKIIETFILLMENKYRLMAERQQKKQKALSMEELCDHLKRDFMMLATFLQMSSAPFIDAFGVRGAGDRAYFGEAINEFTLNYLRNHEAMGSVIRKILSHFSKHSDENRQFQVNCPDLAQLQTFDIPQKLRIEGRFVYSISSLIDMSQAVRGRSCLSKLCEIRASIHRDLDEYHSQKKTGSGQVTSEAQLQILKYLLTKLKIFSCEILGQLHYLQVLYGDEMAFRYDEASYIHSQLLCAFEAIQRKL